MVAPCSPLSRTLCAGFAGAAGGILDSACARRSAGRQVGTKGWPFGRTKGWISCGGGHLCALVIGIEQRLALQQGAKDIEQTIADATQCPCMAMATAAQLGVALLADRIVLNGDPRPVVEGLP